MLSKKEIREKQRAAEAVGKLFADEIKAAIDMQGRAEEAAEAKGKISADARIKAAKVLQGTAEETRILMDKDKIKVF